MVEHTRESLLQECLNRLVELDAYEADKREVIALITKLRAYLAAPKTAAVESAEGVTADALKSANDMCRSAYQVALRDGAGTNWPAFRARMLESLEIQHKAMHPEDTLESVINDFCAEPLQNKMMLARYKHRYPQFAAELDAVTLIRESLTESDEPLTQWDDFRIRQAMDKLKGEDAAMLQLIDERDEAQEAISQAYYLVIGESAPWSSLWGYADCLQEIEDALTMLRKSATQAPEPQFTASMYGTAQAATEAQEKWLREKAAEPCAGKGEDESVPDFGELLRLQGIATQCEEMAAWLEGAPWPDETRGFMFKVAGFLQSYQFDLLNRITDKAATPPAAAPVEPGASMPSGWSDCRQEMLLAAEKMKGGML